MTEMILDRINRIYKIENKNNSSINLSKNLFFNLILNIFVINYLLKKVMLYQNITQKIIRAAFNVYNYFGYGFLETVYERSMLIELNNMGLQIENQIPVKVFYHGEEVGYYIADLLVEGKVIVELKSVSALTKAHEVQLVNYLTATNLDVGLLINFGESGVEIKRKYRLKNLDQPNAESNI